MSKLSNHIPSINSDMFIGEIEEDSRVAAIRTMREDHARMAREARAKYLRSGKGFVVATRMAAISGALILYGTGGEPVSQPDTYSEKLFSLLSQGWLRTALFLAQIAALAWSAYAATQLRELKLPEEWTRERRAAELGRIDMFNTILSVGAERGPQYQIAAFDYWVQNQLRGQIMFYEEAAKRHRGRATRTVQAGAVVAALVAAAGATGSLSGQLGEIWIAIAAFAGVITPMLVSAVRSWQETTLDLEKAERYRNAKLELTKISSEAGAARQALAEGQSDAANALVQRVHDVMNAENEGWLPTHAKHGHGTPGDKGVL